MYRHVNQNNDFLYIGNKWFAQWLQKLIASSDDLTWPHKFFRAISDFWPPEGVTPHPTPHTPHQSKSKFGDNFHTLKKSGEKCCRVVVGKIIASHTSSLFLFLQYREPEIQLATYYTLHFISPAGWELGGFQCFEDWR